MTTRFFFIAPLMLFVVFAAYVVVPQGAAADTAADIAARRAALQTQLDQLNAQIAEQQKILEQKRSETASFQRTIDILAAQIQKDELSIKARNLSIQKLTDDIGSKNNTIAVLDAKTASELKSLAQILRKTNSIDKSTLAEIILSPGTVSSFFEDINSFASVNAALQVSFTQITDTKTATAAAKADLEDKRSQEQELRQQQVIQENQLKADRAQQAILLAGAKAQEDQTKGVIQASQKVIAEIEAELFTLRDTAAIPFGRALAYANEASAATGVRPAYILATLKQESDLGANVGSCLVTNLSTGDGVGKNTGRAFSGVMKSPRDTVPFQAITSALGIPWASTPVSCPQRYGYGGAMGPSQFIPSTWQLYVSRLSKALGVSIPNPWNPKDAIMATALYMADLGADSGTYDAEHNAACKYYSGRSCTSSTQFYGDQVMDNTAYFQNQIDIVQSGS